MKTSTRKTSIKTIPFRALMPGQTALSSVAKRNLRLSPSLKREDLGEITAPFRIKGVLGISEKFVYKKELSAKNHHNP